MSQKILSSLVDKGVLSKDAEAKLLSLMTEHKEKFSGIFERYEQLDDEEKQQFFDVIVGKIKRSLHDKIYTNSTVYTQLLYSHSYIVFIFAILFIVLILVFFVYKLFKVLSERQTKREEKKKIKQMKKKK